jgi:hypothetical protein
MRPIGRLTRPGSAGKRVRALTRLSRRRSSMTRVTRVATSGCRGWIQDRPAFPVSRASFALVLHRAVTGSLIDGAGVATKVRRAMRLRRESSVPEQRSRDVKALTSRADLGEVATRCQVRRTILPLSRVIVRRTELVGSVRAGMRSQVPVVDTNRAGVNALCSTSGRFLWVRS